MLNKFLYVVQKRKDFCAIATFTLGLTASISANAASVTYTTNVAAFNASINSNGSLVNGLSKFDPSLGTLTAITMTATGSYSVDFDIIAFVDDDEQPHSIDGSISYQGSISLNKPGTFTGLLAANQAQGVDFSCGGDPFDGACTDNFNGPISDSGNYMGSSANDSSTLLSRLVLNDFLDQFIGVDDIANGVLEVGLFAFIGGINIYDQTNITIEDLEGSYMMGSTTVTIEYEYTPTVVPLPSAAWLLGSAIFGLFAARQRRQS